MVDDRAEAAPHPDPSAEDPAPEVRARTSSRAFFPCLDGVRALAALSVVVHHVAAATGTYDRDYWGPLFGHLDIGVTVFFLLSGFLLYRPFVLAHFEGRPIGSVLHFYVRRALRIIPAYWVALTVFIVVFGTIEVRSVEEGVVYYTFTQIYFRQYALTGIVQAWTLCVEVSFYLALPLLALAIRRFAISSQHRLRVEFGVVATLFAVGWTVRLVLLWNPFFDAPAQLWLPAQLDLFALGMGLAVVSAAGEAFGRPARVLSRMGEWPGACWATSLAVFVVGSEVVGNGRVILDVTRGQAIGKAIFYPLAAFLVFVPVVFGDQSRGFVRRALRGSAPAWLGLVSYGIYLWHKDIIELLAPADALGVPILRSWIPNPRFGALLAVTLALSIPIAAASWYGLERPIVRRKWASRR